VSGTGAPGPADAGAAGLAIESATAHVEVAVIGADGGCRAEIAEDVGFGHTRRLTPLIAQALKRAGVSARDLAWVAADLGPGSFTGVRVGLATAEALALASGARLLGASSLASLAHGAGARRSLVVPLVPAGRRDLYAGFFRADARGKVTLLAAPRVGEPALVLEAAAECLTLLGDGRVRFVGPGAARERAALEARHPGGTEPAWRTTGLSARDLAVAALLRAGPAGGLPPPHTVPRPLYVRPAQAEERVRLRALAGIPMTIRPLLEADVPAVVAIERSVFPDPWTPDFFRSELALPMVHARVAELEGRVAGYLVAWLGPGEGHLGNLAVVPEARRRGVARRLLEDLLEHAGALAVHSIALEVRVSNFAAQALYRGYGFRLAGLRRGYYRESGEDALIMQWQDPRAPRRGTSGTRSHLEN
jgi:tRNA threonylcarbamoyl adenosine modification protein YeaZ/ribosomal-protein-alanine acetyltransferase